MRRLNCPWCDRAVDINGSDLIKSVNGHGRYKTEIYAHRSCYEKSIRRKSDGNNDSKKVVTDSKKDE